ncbi:hypothetical protein QE152_g9255 [Popillia japonica]|uniref:Uncharacterized protein n=1 Tax=Popillia japonica TaxID=7064 RepID=A0AAW1LXH6_POPJA
MSIVITSNLISKTEIKSATRELVNILGTLSRKRDILSVHYAALVNKVSQVDHTTKATEAEKESIQAGVQREKEYCSIGVQADGNEIEKSEVDLANEIKSIFEDNVQADGNEIEKSEVDLANEIKSIFEDNEGRKGLYENKANKAVTQEEPEEVFRTPQDIRSLPLTESSRQTLRSTDKGTPKNGDAGSRNPSDGEEIVWLDEEMATSPIYRLDENEGDDSQICAESPLKKKRKRDEQINKRKKTVEQKRDILSVHYAALVNKVSQVDHTTKATEAEKESIQAGVQREKEYCSIGVQADGNEIEKSKVDLANEIKSIFEENEGWKGLSKIIDQKWPRHFFKNTTPVEPQAIRRRNGNLAVIVNPNGFHYGQVSEDIKLRFPEIATLLEEK